MKAILILMICVCGISLTAEGAEFKDIWTAVICVYFAYIFPIFDFIVCFIF